jgi:Arc/MetJ-type ribon-helix-helix transcriptional regulator
MAEQERENWSVPVSVDFADELRARMATEGFESKSEFVRAALREKLERSARRRLEAAFIEGLDSPTSEKSTRELLSELRGLARGEAGRGPLA